MEQNLGIVEDANNALVKYSAVPCSVLIRVAFFVRNRDSSQL
jgi:hypothetical protein